MALIRTNLHTWSRFLKTWQMTGASGVLSTAWMLFWMQFAGARSAGRVAMWLATWLAPPYYERRRLARYSSRGYIAPSVVLYHQDLQLGTNIFIGDRVTIFQDKDGGSVELQDRVHLYGDSCIQTGESGTLKIGTDTHVQPRCQFSAYKASIKIGSRVQIAPNCAFYPYNHGVAPNQPIMTQPLTSGGDIVIGDGAWLGFGVIVLEGVCIGKGATIGAGAVVTKNIPDGAIAVGVPARVVGLRKNIT